jgi:hypothetical protein
MPNSLAFAASASTCVRDSGSAMPLERLFRRADLALRHAQTFEGLRARHLVHEMAIDVEETGAVRLLIDEMIVPDFVVESARFHVWLLAKSKKRVENTRRTANARLKRCLDRSGQAAEETARQARMIAQHDKGQRARSACVSNGFHRRGLRHEAHIDPLQPARKLPKLEEHYFGRHGKA